ncbi:SRPBCC domain-containing protein [Sandaracinobacteroides saxicola]|uniref:SRPBCC domain-containing protein n=1 Tax=Sandaracinobacteroides saxicola TaxID=2759707 RepID=A0A7G5IHF6_9SPHN|nr:SRPBCC domain-containing protein [Sandaracinobacteroides saxicola]QMW22798.1 SRPBCC domain-containing protein [Sandaracinobacteroides saxicola]
MTPPLTIATEVEIAATPERVWAILTDFAAYPQWNPYIVAIEGDATPGTVMQVHSVPLPGAPEMVAPVLMVSADFPLMCWEGGLADRGQFRGDHRWRLEAIAGGTRVAHVEDFSGTLAPDILARHGDTVRAAFERFDAALKTRCEA